MAEDDSTGFVMEAIKATCDDGDWPYPPALVEWLEQRAASD